MGKEVCVFSLSFAQQRLWFLDQLYPGNRAYTYKDAIRLTGPLDVAALERIIVEIVRRHEILRTTFPAVDGQAVQVIASEPDVTLRVIHLRQLPHPGAEVEALNLASELIQQPFDLTAGPLFRPVLLRLSEEDHILLVMMHHMVCDAWSLKVFYRELSVLYSAFREGKPSPLPDLPIQYADFAVWQREWLRGEVLERQLAYWRQRLAGLQVIDLPTDNARPPMQKFEGAVHGLELSHELAQRLKALSREENATLFMALLGAFSLLLAHYSGREDIAVGSPIANRTRPEIEGLIGFFDNTLVLRADLSGDPSFREILRRIREVCLEAYTYQDLPFEKLVDELQPERDPSRTPLFQVMFTLEYAPSHGVELPGLMARFIPIDTGRAKFDLSVSIIDKGDGLAASLRYRRDLFEATTIERLGHHLQTLLERIVADPDQRISALPLLTEREQRQVMADWNATAMPVPEALVHELVAEQAARTPDAVAVVAEQGQLTYGELNRSANRLAHYFRQLGVGPEVRVGLCVDRSPELVIGLLAILKAGGAYVPLDPSFPSARLTYTMEDCQANLLVAQDAVLEHVDTLVGRVLCLNREAAVIAAQSDEDLPASVHADNLAYVIYTSGSTGRPKGVMVTHRALTNVLYAVRRELEASREDVLVAVSAISFDISGLEIYLPLIVGARLVLASRSLLTDPQRFGALLHGEGATVLQATPALWRLLADAEEVPAVKALSGGELLPRDLADRLIDRCQSLWNLYGPTETTIWSTIHRVTGGTRVVPIGRPIANTAVYVVDRHLRPVPIGVTGELCIGGVGLARGYWGRPDLTAERFVPDSVGGHPGARLYLTGDLARWRSDGFLEFLGRVDDQLKIRGYRIEPGEIEVVLTEHPSVRAAAVVAREGVGGERQLVAYVTADGDHHGEHELRAFLQTRLPEYMVPQAIVFLKAFPLTPTGKFDRRALPAAEELRVRGGEGFVAPRRPVEEVVATIWADVLGLDRVGMYDSFFELGGHSFLATQVISRVREALEVEVPLHTIFEAPTVAGLAERIAALKQAGGEALGEVIPRLVSDPDHRYDPFPLTDIQHAYWVGREGAIELGNVASHRYIEIDVEHLDLERYQHAVRRLIARHDMLHAVVLPNGQQQILKDVQPYHIEVEDLRGLPPSDVEARLEEARRRKSHQVFDPERWPLFDITASHLVDSRYRLHLSIDYLIADAWSFQVLTDEWAYFYEHPDGELPPLEISYRDYVRVVAGLEDTEAYRRAERYWAERLARLPGGPELPLARPLQSLEQPRFVRRQAQLEAALWRRLKARAARAGLTPSGLLLAAYAQILEAWSATPDFAIVVTLFNRLPVHSQVYEIVGDFTSTIPLVVRMGEGTFKERARRVQEQLWEDLDHRFVSGVRVLRERLRAEGGRMRALMPVVFTSTLGLPEREPQKRQPRKGRVVFGITQTPQVLLDHQVGETPDGGLSFAWDAVEALFAEGVLDDMFGAYSRLLQQLAHEDDSWETPALTIVPEYQLEQRAAVNATQGPVSDELLHTLFDAQVPVRPEQAALVAPDRTLTYGELYARSNQVGWALRDLGVQPNALVGVVMEKGWEQVVAVLGILKAGAAYLPIDPALPRERIWHLLEHGQVRVALTQPRVDHRLEWPDGLRRLRVTDADLATFASEPLARVQSPDDLAYVIFTSGSTGLPKGVMITHRCAVNTVLDMNGRFAIGSGDRVLALSALSFDLSVYDIFGLLAAGGTLVLPDAQRTRDPAHWTDLVLRHGVTVWNSVPALMTMLVEYAQAHPEVALQSLHLILLSGDWIPVNLPDKIRSAASGVQVVSLGGATEASIWSILFPIDAVDPTWRSIPYGLPMRNQRMYVLDHRLDPRPVWVRGRLCIGGLGVAVGYWRDPERTAASFIIHPRTGERLYDTGDLGRYLPDGNIEFLGREDSQVKIHGYRIELGEIEATLIQHSAVRDAVAAALGDSGGPRRLVAYVVPDRDPAPSSGELRAFLQQKLPEYMIPATYAMLDALPLSANGKIDRQALPVPAAEHAEESRSIAGPRTPVEEAVAAIFCDILGLDQVGMDDDFFSLGGDSVRAILLVSRLREAFSVELPLRRVFEAPTVGDLALAVVQHQADQADQELVARMIAELEAMPVEEVQRLLQQEIGGQAGGQG